DEAVQRQAGGAERADAGVCPGLLGLVPVVQHEQALGEEESEEAGADELAHALRVVHRGDRLGKHLEERDRDDDSAGQCNRSRQLAAQEERGQSSDPGRARGYAREWDGEPGHAGMILAIINRMSAWSEQTLAALAEGGLRSGGARRAVIELLGRQ